MTTEALKFDVPGILGCQKNRYPMLFLDRVTECIPGKYAKGYKLFLIMNGISTVTSRTNQRCGTLFK